MKIPYHNSLFTKTLGHCVSAILPCLSCTAGTWSLVDDFDLANNGVSNPWSYGTDQVAGEPVQFVALTANTRDANNLWGTDIGSPPTMWSDATGYWGIGRNDSGVVQTATGDLTWNPGEVLLQPQNAIPGRLVIAWTAPLDTTIDFNYTFERPWPTGNVGYQLVSRIGGVDTVVEEFAGSNNTNLGPIIGSQTGLAVSTGDQLFWRIDSWGAGGADGDITKASIEIQSPNTGPIQITDIVRDPQTFGPTITFNSVDGATYAVWGSPDLQNWVELDDKVVGTGDSTQFTDSIFAPDHLGRFFYQVRKF